MKTQTPHKTATAALSATATENLAALSMLAIFTGGSWSGRTLSQIATDLCAPFGIAVRWEVTDAAASKAFGVFKLEHSETVYETMDNIERLTEYGLISVPLTGSQAVLAFVVADGRTRPGGLKAGDSGLYHAEGHQILLTENGEIVIKCKKLRFEVEESIGMNCKTFALNASESATVTAQKIGLNGALDVHDLDGGNF